MKVLDKGELKLVSSMGSDYSILQSARVSFDNANQAPDVERDTKLLRYLWKNKHTTPFESVTFTFYVKAPIFVLRQWHRHRTQSYNEVSARYTELPDKFYVPEVKNIGIQSIINKQGRDTLFSSDDERAAEVEVYKMVCETAFSEYKNLLEKGWPRELARMVLPVSTYSKMFCTMNLLNLLRFCTLRTDSHAQFEIREYANGLISLIEPTVPITVEAWRDYGG